MIVYGVVSKETEKAVETFVRLEQAERFLEDVRADDPDLAERLRLEPVEPRPTQSIEEGAGIREAAADPGTGKTGAPEAGTLNRSVTSRGVG